MNEPFAATSRSKEPFEGEMVDDLQALRAGLELARASQLTMLRLQLALHESNPRTAMQSVDILLDIDAEMEGIAATLVSVPANTTDAAALSGFIEHQKAAIAAEKHALMGGNGRNNIRPIANFESRAFEGVDPSTQALVAEDEWDADSPPKNRWWIVMLAAAITVALLGLGLMVYLSPETFGIGRWF